MAGITGPKTGSAIGDRMKKELKEVKGQLAKLQGEIATLKDELESVTSKLEGALVSLEASESSRKTTEESLQKKETEFKDLHDRVNCRSTAAAPVIERELTETQKMMVGQLARKELWKKYKVVNELSFGDKVILNKCHEQMGLTSASDQKSLERSIKLEYCRSLSQHKYYIKNAIMSAWMGK